VLALDRKLVRRAIDNLIINALKYSPANGVVDVTIGAGAEGVEIGIADRGPGIPDVSKDRLFEKFGSVEGSMTDTRRGFGLGLYMVRLVAEAHLGRVSARDREGGGTVFTVLLPSISIDGPSLPVATRSPDDAAP
jgi:signal transduction histidine kinase